MFKYFTANNIRQYVDVLNDLVSQYNGTKHSSIKVTPVMSSKPENNNRTYMNLRSCPRIKSVRDTPRSRQETFLFRRRQDRRMRDCAWHSATRPQHAHRIACLGPICKLFFVWRVTRNSTYEHVLGCSSVIGSLSGNECHNLN
jgi:hypothetical protein